MRDIVAKSKKSRTRRRYDEGEARLTPRRCTASMAVVRKHSWLTRQKLAMGHGLQPHQAVAGAPKGRIQRCRAPQAPVETEQVSLDA